MHIAPIVLFFSVTYALYPFAICQDQNSEKFFGLTGIDDDLEEPTVPGFSYHVSSYWCTFNGAVMADPASPEELKEALDVYKDCFVSNSPEGVWLESYLGMESPFGCGWLLQENGDLVARSDCSETTFRAPTICRKN